MLLLLGVLLVWGSIRAEAAEEPEEETVPEAAREWIDEMDFRDVEYKNFTKKEEEIIDLFYFKFQDIPLLSRMEQLQRISLMR